MRRLLTYAGAGSLGSALCRWQTFAVLPHANHLLRSPKPAVFTSFPFCWHRSYAAMRGKFALKAGMVFKQGAETRCANWRCECILKKPSNPQENEYIMVCDDHKGTWDNTDYILTLCFLIAVLK